MWHKQAKDFCIPSSWICRGYGIWLRYSHNFENLVVCQIEKFNKIYAIVQHQNSVVLSMLYFVLHLRVNAKDLGLSRTMLQGSER